MSAPRLPFLYPNLMRAVRACDQSSHRTIRISNKTKHAPLTSCRRYAQQSYHRRYGPAAEANLPPPSRPKGAAPTPPVPKDSDQQAAEAAPPEQLPEQDAQSDNAPEKESLPSESTPKEAKEAEIVAEPGEGHNANEPEPNEEPAAEEEPDVAPPNEPAKEQQRPRPDVHPHHLGANPLDGVLHMPSPSSQLTTSGFTPSDDAKGPHLTPALYVHHFDTYSLVRDLSTGGFTDDQSVTVMKAVRGILGDNYDLAKQTLTSKSDVENESYLFKAACSELQSSLQTSRNSEMQRQRASRTQLQHEADILSQRLNQELMGLKDDIKGMFNDHKMVTRENQRSIDTSVQELNYKITVSLNSDGKSEIESLRWILTRRAAMAIAISAFMIILFLKYYSVLKTHDVAEKQKEPPVKETPEKKVSKDVAAEQPPISMLEAHVSESLG
ncbi:hypothetical protein P168DRAFT_303067 [Aspergillus campestris IBT 28561]|uniref:MOZ protein represents a chromatin-associated acetyltransferase n=1 Tax=Aspergillus campestris (strain IBT 28561) TaxID=1392248 RepID=A0A2I1DA99_ASPC2|nr:uncharacterized protein P168DRAFT_303067 [Aspergillus campestris IBT 28561]PKY06807.1 hypothetical protein P168DRAFT_303067 [Aspergillus campestris IBT 28561]